MRIRIVVCLSAVFLIAGAAMMAWADVPTSMNVQGQLTNSAGLPELGTKAFCFAIFDAQAGGTKIWPASGECEEQQIEIKPAGLWNAHVGAGIPLTRVVFEDTARWLQITVAGEILSPRIKLNSNPFSYRSATSQRADTSIVHVVDSIHTAYADTAGYALSIANSSITTPKLADGAVTNPKLSNSAVTTDKIQDGTILFGDVGTNGATSGQVIKYSGSQWGAGPDSTGGWYDAGTVVRLGSSTDNVGIGTTSPNAKLDVNGGISFYFDWTSNWYHLDPGEEHVFNIPSPPGPINPDSCIVILDGKNGCGIHQANYGSNYWLGQWIGCEWDELNNGSVRVTRGAGDDNASVPTCKRWDYVRVRIIKRQ